MKFKQFQVFVLLFYLSISTNISTSAFDQSLVGVKDGEEFTFILQQYSVSLQSKTLNSTETVDYLYGNEGVISIETGDRFTYRILDATVHHRSTEEVKYLFPYAIEVEIIGPNGTTVTDDLSIGFGTILTETNWTGFKDVVEEGRDVYDLKQISNPDISYIYEIIDDNSEFGWKFGSVFIGNDSDHNTFSNIREIRYEKKTGMATLLSIEFIHEQFEDSKRYKSEIITKIVRENFSPDNNSTKLPGFIFYSSITSLFVLIYQKKK